MYTETRWDLTVRRNDDVWERPLRIIGPNLTDVDLRAQIRLTGDTPGRPYADLLLVTNGNAEGVRLASAVQQDGGAWENDVRIRLNKSTRQALPYQGELGEPAVLEWGFLIDGITRIEGKVFVPAQVYGSDNAPRDRPPSYGARTRAAMPVGGATLTISQDGGATLVIDGADLVAREAGKALDAALASEQSRQASEFASQTALAAGRYYATRAMGEAASAVGQPFSTKAPDNSGTLIYYERTADGSTEIGRALTPAALRAASAAAMIGASDGETLQQNVDHAGWYTAPGVGGLKRKTATRLLGTTALASDYGALSTGTVPTSAALTNTATNARVPFTDGPGRVFSKKIDLEPGEYLLEDILQLAPASGVVGLMIVGVGDGSTVIKYSGAAATIKAQSSRAVSFQNITFKSSGIDDNQVAFTIAPGANPLRSWTFVNCSFQAFYTCFDVLGTTMCSEFYFYSCRFQNCYRLMSNANTQAVNWNFINCDWEHDNLLTTKNKAEAAAFFLKAGTKVAWYGGSFIFRGRIVLFNLTVAGRFERVGHGLYFSGARIELIDEGGTHVPFWDRIDAGWINGTNQPATTFQGCQLLKRDGIGIGNDIAIARVWSNCSLAFRDCTFQICHVTGVIDGNTTAAPADVMLDHNWGIGYLEDTSARTSDHDQHNVTIIPNNATSATVAAFEGRASNFTSWARTNDKMWVSGPTGSLPTAGTTVNLPPLQIHTRIRKLFVDAYSPVAANATFTVELRDQADTTSYGSLTLTAGQNNGEAYVGKEIGFQIPAATALMLKFSGTVALYKGAVGLVIL